mmetsp:Transcript_19814/g.22815  ORF Transcript_19814/g.22815 Transcript_19814/m.22815 type:complete len:259 (+) Transcript_19814:317-1093(+)
MARMGVDELPSSDDRHYHDDKLRKPLDTGIIKGVFAHQLTKFLVSSLEINADDPGFVSKEKSLSFMSFPTFWGKKKKPVTLDGQNAHSWTSSKVARFILEYKPNTSHDNSDYEKGSNNERNSARSTSSDSLSRPSDGILPKNNQNKIRNMSLSNETDRKGVSDLIKPKINGKSGIIYDYARKLTKQQLDWYLADSDKTYKSASLAHQHLLPILSNFIPSSTVVWSLHPMVLWLPSQHGPWQRPAVSALCAALPLAQTI